MSETKMNCDICDVLIEQFIGDNWRGLLLVDNIEKKEAIKVIDEIYDNLFKDDAYIDFKNNKIILLFIFQQILVR